MQGRWQHLEHPLPVPPSGHFSCCDARRVLPAINRANGSPEELTPLKENYFEYTVSKESVTFNVENGKVVGLQIKDGQQIEC